MDFMQEAIKQAKLAEKHGEVPIGAVIVLNQKIIAVGRNMREKKQNALLHAELVAINKACKKLHSWRLENCEMYVTLEPCPMCAGAIVNARIKKVTYACQEKTSSDGLFEKITQSTRLNHTCQICQDQTYQAQCAKMLSDFFKKKRK